MSHEARKRAIPVFGPCWCDQYGLVDGHTHWIQVFESSPPWSNGVIDILLIFFLRTHGTRTTCQLPFSRFATPPWQSGSRWRNDELFFTCMGLAKLRTYIFSSSIECLIVLFDTVLKLLNFNFSMTKNFDTNDSLDDVLETVDDCSRMTARPGIWW